MALALFFVFWTPCLWGRLFLLFLCLKLHAPRTKLILLLCRDNGDGPWTMRTLFRLSRFSTLSPLLRNCFSVAHHGTGLLWGPLCTGCVLHGACRSRGTLFPDLQPPPLLKRLRFELVSGTPCLLTAVFGCWQPWLPLRSPGRHLVQWGWSNSGWRAFLPVLLLRVPEHAKRVGSVGMHLQRCS